MKTFPFGSVTAISLFAPSVKSRLKQQLKLFPTIWQLNNACRNSHFNGPSTKVKKALSVNNTVLYPTLFLSIQFSSKLYATIQTVAKPLLFSVIRKERLFNSGSICFICASGLNRPSHWKKIFGFGSTVSVAPWRLHYWVSLSHITRTLTCYTSSLNLHI